MKAKKKKKFARCIMNDDDDDDDDDSEDGGASWRYLERNYLKMILNSTTAKSARYTIEFAGREFKWNSLAAWNA